MILFIFSGLVYSWDRVLLIFTMGIMVNIGVNQEEKHLEKYFSDYKNYKKNMSFKYLPNLAKLFKKSKLNEEDKKD